MAFEELRDSGERDLDQILFHKFKLCIQSKDKRAMIAENHTRFVKQREPLKLINVLAMSDESGCVGIYETNKKSN